MKKLLIPFITLLLALPVSSAFSESKIPNLVGVWKVDGEGAVLTRKSDDSAKADVAVDFKKLDAESVIEKQQGRSFYGYYKSSVKTEKFVGVIGADNKSAHWVGRWGFGRVEIIAPDKMRVIYLQANPHGSQAWSETLTKKK